MIATIVHGTIGVAEKVAKSPVKGSGIIAFAILCGLLIIPIFLLGLGIFSLVELIHYLPLLIAAGLFFLLMVAAKAFGVETQHAAIFAGVFTLPIVALFFFKKFRSFELKALAFLLKHAGYDVTPLFAIDIPFDTTTMMIIAMVIMVMMVAMASAGSINPAVGMMFAMIPLFLIFYMNWGTAGGEALAMAARPFSATARIVSATMNDEEFDEITEKTAATQCKYWCGIFPKKFKFTVELTDIVCEKSPFDKRCSPREGVCYYYYYCTLRIKFWTEPETCPAKFPRCGTAKIRVCVDLPSSYSPYTRYKGRVKWDIKPSEECEDDPRTCYNYRSPEEYIEWDDSCLNFIVDGMGEHVTMTCEARVAVMEERGYGEKPEPPSPPLPTPGERTLKMLLLFMPFFLMMPMMFMMAGRRRR